jgi:cell division protein FtsB
MNLATAVEFQAEIARLQAVIDSLRQEVLEQRREIAGLREERRAILDADRTPGCTETGGM